MNRFDSTPDTIRQTVRASYGAIARAGASCCGPAPAASSSTRLGYTEDELTSVPEGADLGLGCGHPVALASLAPGEVVVDLGAGAGLDALIAAERVGPTGRVIGVDMTPEMLERARAQAVKAGVHGFVEFREGLIEDLPVASETADVVISNCVVNLSPDKAAAFREAFRVLKPGGRLAISDIVLSAPLPEEVLGLAESYVACVAGAALAEDYLAGLRAAGFVDIEHTRSPAGPVLLGASGDPLLEAAREKLGEPRLKELAGAVWSYKITAKRP